MRSKAPLALMEQMVMIAVFALAAALCIQAFVHSDQASRRSEARDRAVELCQWTAEAVRASGGALADAAVLAAGGQPTETETGWTVDYDADWTAVTGGGAYRLTVERLATEQAGLGLAQVRVTALDGTDEALFSLEVAWQEVSGHD